MDPFSLTVGVIGILQGVTSCLKCIKKHVGPSALSSAETENLIKSLYKFHGAMTSFKTHLELYDDDDDRLKSLEYLKPVITRSHESLQIVKTYLDSKRTEKVFRGVKFDKKLKTSLKSLDDATKLFGMAVLADQQAIVLGVKSYVEAMSVDFKDVQAVQLSAQQDNLYHDVRAWLDAQADNNMNSQLHERNLLARHVGSGEWLLRNDTFQGWVNTSASDMQSKLWLRGSPGAGKSVLCSTGIHHVSNTLQEICLYYFHRFDDQSGPGGDDLAGSGVRAAATLIDQLFRYFWRQDRRIASSVSAYIKTVEKTITSLAEMTRLILRQGYQYAQENGTISDAEPIGLYIFLDGLDEKPTSCAEEELLTLFGGHEEGISVIQKVWISSRETTVLKQRLKQWLVINADDHAEADVKSFLADAVPKFNDNMGIDQEVESMPLDDWILEKLQMKAKGNFHYARLMVEQLKDGVFTVDDIIVLIKSRVPNIFTEMYKRIFCQYQEDQHKYISPLFSLIAFARRPLHLHELREAMALALSDPTEGLDPLKVPINLQRLFAPLIEIQNDPKDLDNPLCRLCHSTVREFLTTNPNVLQAGASSQAFFAYAISPSQVGDLCIRYLCQKKYSTLMKLPSVDCYGRFAFSDDEERKHGFLPYSGKYWDRHLGDLKPTQELRKLLRGFLGSPNFQTLLQAQNHELSDPEYIEECHKIRLDYRHYVNEWGYLLERSACVLPKCPAEHFWGEVDRCLTGLLGPTHFMNQMKEKYPSFMLTYDPFKYHDSKRTVLAETVSTSTLQYMAISSPSQDSSEVFLDVWDLNLPDGPRLVSSRYIPTPHVDLKSDTARPIAFSDEAASFMFGNRAHDKIHVDTQLLIDEMTAGRDFVALSTDLEKQGDIIVVARRNVRKDACVMKSPNKDVTTRNKIKNLEELDVDSSEDESDDSSNDGSNDGYSSTVTDENSAYETCSEGSTEFESDESEDKTSDDGFESDNESTGSLEEYGDEDEEKSDQESDDSEAKPEGRNMIVYNYQQPPENKPDLDGSLLKQKDQDRPAYPGLPGLLRDRKDRITATVAVYKVGLAQAVRVFHYEQDIPAMLYHSPPVLHPHKALLAWPLGGGEVLFADYDEKTYFIRATMPTTHDTRHICMKARFSPCGNYFHIASIEARLASPKPASAASLDGANGDKQEITLSLFLTSYRLSSRKTTRSPPRLVHKVKFSFGQFTGLSLTRLPFTFTWTSGHLYFTVSGSRLNVFRIGLFRPAMSSSALVTVPQLSVMLPLSASGRQVHYLPSVVGGGVFAGRGIVLMGSYGACCQRVQLRHKSLRVPAGMGEVVNKELLDYACPAVGFLVDDKDLGEWVTLSMEREEGGKVKEVGVMETGSGSDRFRDGKLIRKMEMFNWREDVDLEGICDWCNSPLTFG